MIDQLQMQLLEEITGLHEIPQGAYNIRSNGSVGARNTTEHIDIVSLKDKPGMDIIIKPGTKKESVHIPVVMSQSGLDDLVYNNFYVGDDCDVVIIAGCGIHNGGANDSKHDGIHTFYIGNNCKVRYVEKHYGQGDGMGKRIMNPETIVHMKKNSYLEMEMVQIKGIDSTVRTTTADLEEGSKIVVKEKLLTHGEQDAVSEYSVYLNGASSSANVVSRSVAKEHSKQKFISKVYGNAPCNAHTECDSIIMDEAKITAVPEIVANHPDAALIHEAAIGKIAGEQIIKLMTLGLTEDEAQTQIVNGFLK